jgi:serine protease Do
VAGSGYPTLPVATTAPRLGEPVVVIGNAKGFSNSVSVGIVSGTNRADPTHLHHYPSLQTDAAINPGNSGGPILNRRGEVVAIVAWRAEDGAETLGFGIPVSRLLDTLQRVVPGRGVVRPWLGAAVREPYWSRNDALPNQLGLVVSDIHRDGAAYAGGLHRLDYLTAVDAMPVNDLTQLRQALDKHKPGDTVVLSITRQQVSDAQWADLTLSVTLGEDSGPVPGVIPRLYNPENDDLF